MADTDDKEVSVVCAALHGEEGHVCDRDGYPRQEDPDYRGPHTTRVIPACGSDGEWRAMCACNFLSDIMPTRQAALVSAWVHRMKQPKAPRAAESSE